MKTGDKLTLLKPVLRRKPSLGSFSYTLRPGENVYLVAEHGDKLKVSEIQNASDRISEDYFIISKNQVKIMTTFVLLRLFPSGGPGQSGNQAVQEVEASTKGVAIAHFRRFQPNLDETGYCKEGEISWVVAEEM